MKENPLKLSSSLLSISEKDIIIMQMIANGYRTKQIAEKTTLSIRTIENRILRLRKIFNCKSITHLAITLLRQKIIK